MMRRQRGFTLLEVMIAIGIFALVGLGTYRMLETVLKTDVATRAHEQSLRELTRAFAEIDRDLAQSIPRTVRDPYGEELASLLGVVDGQVALEFTRAGWRNPLGLARAQLQRVRWRLTDEQLERVYWTVLDQAVDSQPRVQKVLDGVTALELRFLDDQGEWQTQWPPAQGQLTAEQARLRMPLAVEFKFEHRHYGELTRLYRLPEAPAAEATKEQDGPTPTPTPTPKPAPEAAQPADPRGAS
jgi:general secretion pathway protein J